MESLLDLPPARLFWYSLELSENQVFHLCKRFCAKITFLLNMEMIIPMQKVQEAWQKN